MVEFDLMGYSVLVDNPEQARKLQEYAFKQGFVWMSGEKEVLYLGCKSFQFGVFGCKKITKTEGREHYQDEDITKKAHYNDIFGETLQEKPLKKEDVYVVLKGKTEEELRDLYAFLIGNNEPLFAPSLRYFLEYRNDPVGDFHLGEEEAEWLVNKLHKDKTEVTIEQLKQIIKPMETETLKEKVERLEKELEQAKKELEDSKPKVGDVAVVDNGEYKAIVVLNKHQVNIFDDAVVLPKELQEQLRPYLETDTFVLPKKWCLKSDDILFVEYCNKNGIFKDSYTPKELKRNYAHFPAINDLYTTYDTIYYGYTEITIEQFKKHVLNK